MGWCNNATDTQESHTRVSPCVSHTVFNKLGLFVLDGLHAEAENNNSPPEENFGVWINSVEIPVVKKRRHLACFLPQRSPSMDVHQVRPGVKLTAIVLGNA